MKKKKSKAKAAKKHAAKIPAQARKKRTVKKTAPTHPARPVGITELVLRDGHQSLVATRMRTDDMLPICETLDRAGYWSLEVWGGATFDACVRFLREDPWERLRKLRRALPNSRLQMLLRGRNLLGYRPYADDVVDAFVSRAAQNGVDVFRVFDAMNDFANMRRALAAVKHSGKHAQGTVCYTTSPVHSVAQLAELGRDFAEAECDSVAIKDMAGIMTPSACAELVVALKKTSGGLPVHVHSHATSGLAAMCLLKAAEVGADVIDTAISPFAEGASHPATETMSAALAGTSRDPKLDGGKLHRAAKYFRQVRRKYWQFESAFTGTDPRVLRHHVPGGMISNLTSQLREQNALDKIGATLKEIPNVRRDLGYPPLVTPTSQIVAAQAALNVVTGQRYASVTREVKNYFLGHYGRIPGEVDPEARRLAVGDAPMSSPAADAEEMERLKNEADGLATSEEDLLTCAMFPEIARAYLQERAAGQLKPEELLPHPEDAGTGTVPGMIPGMVSGTGSGSSPSDATGIGGNGADGVGPSEFRITVHGETHHIRVTGVGLGGGRSRPIYMTLDDVPEEALVEALDRDGSDGESRPAEKIPGVRPRATLPGHVTAAMPGRVLSVAAALGDAVKKGDPVLVIEAMKMEHEVTAPVDGVVVGVLVGSGDSVSPGEALMEIGESDGGIFRGAS